MIVLKVVFCVMVCLPLAYVMRFLISRLVKEANDK
jgi:hypothetical protein